jgi:hypothetical protein
MTPDLEQWLWSELYTTVPYLGVAVVYHINNFLESHQNLLAGPVDLNKEDCRHFVIFILSGLPYRIS